MPVITKENTMKLVSVATLRPNAPGITYVGRNWQGWRASVLGNPHHLRNCPICRRDHERGETLTLYREWLRAEWVKHGAVKAELLRLARLEKAGQEVTLGCWCKHHGAATPCHADVIMDVVRTLVEKGIV
jgi:hypothetical protein